MKMIRSIRFWFVLFISFLLVYRAALVDRGSLSVLHDEFQIAETIHAVRYLLDGDIRGFCFHLTGLGAIPMHNLFRIFPVLLQLEFSNITNTPLFHPDSLQIQLYFNVFISILNCFLFYRISRLLLNGDMRLALLATIIYSLLVNTNLFIRHLLHYDLALFCFFISIYMLIRHKEVSARSLAFAGAFSGMGILTYTGYYYMPALVGFYIFLGRQASVVTLLSNGVWKKQLWIRIKMSLIYTLGFMAVIIFFELIAYAGNTSLIRVFLELGKMPYILGSFDEGYNYILLYMEDVEGIIGIALLGLLIAYWIMTGYSFFKRNENRVTFNNLNLLCILLLVGYLAHGTLVYYFHHKTWHGRLIHIYYPFVIIAATSVFYHIRIHWLKSTGIVLLCVISVYSFVVFTLDYKNLGYPRDILAGQRINQDKIPVENIINEASPFFPFSSPPGKLNQDIDPDERAGGNLKLVNFCFFLPRFSDTWQPFTPGEDDSLIFERNHYNSYKPYGYEHYNRRERRLTVERDYKIRIFKSSPTP